MLDATMPYTAQHQLIVDLANSSREIMGLTPNRRHGSLAEHHAQRIHELMRHRPHNVQDWG